MVDASHRIALHAQHSLGAERGGAHDLRLQRKPVAVAARHVHDRPDALLAGESHSRQRRHSRLAGVVVGQPETSTVSARTAMRSLTRWPSASAGSEISADVRAVTDTGESSQPDAPETRRGRRKEGRQTSLSRSGRSREIWTISQTAAANDGVHVSRRPAIVVFDAFH